MSFNPAAKLDPIENRLSDSKEGSFEFTPVDGMQGTVATLMNQPLGRGGKRKGGWKCGIRVYLAEANHNHNHRQSLTSLQSSIITR